MQLRREIAWGPGNDVQQRWRKRLILISSICKSNQCQILHCSHWKFPCSRHWAWTIVGIEQWWHPHCPGNGSSFAVYAGTCVATNVRIFLSDSSCMPHSFSYCRNCRNLLHESAKSALMASAVPGHSMPVPRPTPINSLSSSAVSILFRPATSCDRTPFSPPHTANWTSRSSDDRLQTVLLLAQSEGTVDNVRVCTCCCPRLLACTTSLPSSALVCTRCPTGLSATLPRNCDGDANRISAAVLDGCTVRITRPVVSLLCW